MRIVIQRVTEAELKINYEIFSAIHQGLLIFIGIEESDSPEDVTWLIQKIIQMRIFSDSDGKMNLNLQDIQGEVMLVSQFTLHASTKKGNRPSFIRAARPEQAIPLYELFVEETQKMLGESKVKTGIFGGDMKIMLVNDGPVTIIIDSKNKD